MTFGRAFTLWYTSLFWASTSYAALVVESTLQEGKKAALPNKLTMDSAGLRSESAEGIFIFRPDKQLLWMLDTTRKEYSQITESELSQMGAKMDEAMKQMNEQLAQLPPEQRAMVEEMMKKQQLTAMPAGDVSGDSILQKSIFAKTAKGEKVGDWSCEKYAEQKNGVKVGEIWTVPSATFSGFTSYFKMLQKLGSFFGKLPAAQGMSLEFPMLKAAGAEEDSGLSGIPVKDIRYGEEGIVLSQWQLTKISEETVDALLFELPKDYKKRSLLEEK